MFTAFRQPAGPPSWLSQASRSHWLSSASLVPGAQGVLGRGQGWAPNGDAAQPVMRQSASLSGLSLGQIPPCSDPGTQRPLSWGAQAVFLARGQPRPSGSALTRCRALIRFERCPGAEAR